MCGAPPRLSWGQGSGDPSNGSSLRTDSLARSVVHRAAWVVRSSAQSLSKSRTPGSSLGSRPHARNGGTAHDGLRRPGRLEAPRAWWMLGYPDLAVGRHLQQRSGLTIKKVVRTLRAARSAGIDINGQRMTLDPELTGPAPTILDRLETGHQARWHDSGLRCPASPTPPRAPSPPALHRSPAWSCRDRAAGRRV